MKNLMKYFMVMLFVTLLFSCQPQPQYVAVQQQQAQGDPNQFYNDPQYANQPPVQYMYNGQQILIDAALMAYLYNYHINPGYYYSTHIGYSHFHVYRNGVYSGYAAGYHPTFVTYNHYHYTAPNPKYVTKSGRPDMRYNANKSSQYVTKSGKPDMRYKANRPSSSSSSSSRSSSSRSSGGRHR